MVCKWQAMKLVCELEWKLSVMSRLSAMPSRHRLMLAAVGSDQPSVHTRSLGTAAQNLQ